MKKTSIILFLFSAQLLFGQISQITNFTNSNPFDNYTNYKTVLAIGNNYYFTGEGDAGLGKELWVTDGTATGTRLVKDISPGTESTVFNAFTEMNGVLYFIAGTSTYGEELWRSDGTEAGTYILKDIDQGSSDGLNIAFDKLLVHNNKIYFSAYTDANRKEPWVSDGTSTGTKLLKDIHTTGNSSPEEFFILGNNVYFFANSDDFGPVELWKTDGTTGGTVKIKNIEKGGKASGVSYVASNGNTTYFSTRIGFDYQLWSTDGTALNTNFVTTIEAGIDQMVVLANGKVLFTVDYGDHKDDLWVTDGTVAGTKVLKDFKYFFAETPYSLVEFEDYAYVLANDEDNALVVKTDGTEAGTTTIAEFETTTSGGDQYLLPLTNELLIIAYKSWEENTEIYTSKGTKETTKLLSNLNVQNARSSEPSDFAELANGNVIFKAEKITDDRELFIYSRSTLAPLSLTLTIDKNILCHNDATGEISAVVVGGLAPYQYLWSTGATTKTIKNLAGGKYKVTITDANGSKSQNEISLTNPTEIVIQVTTTPATSANNDGKAIAVVTGGAGNYTYQWSNNNKTNSISNVAAGTYSVTVTDGNGCKVTKQVLVEMISATEDLESCTQLSNSLISTELFIQSCQSGFHHISILDQNGRILYINSYSNSILIPVSHFSSGIYFVKIMDDKKQSTVKKIVKI